MNRMPDQTRGTLAAYAFAIHELELYLDTHPTCEKALLIRDELQTAMADLRAELTANGEYRPRTAHNVKGETRWTWIDGLWPWEYGFEP